MMICRWEGHLKLQRRSLSSLDKFAMPITQRSQINNQIKMLLLILLLLMLLLLLLFLLLLLLLLVLKMESNELLYH